MTHPKTPEKSPTRDEDEVLRRMLATKPIPHKPKTPAAKKTKGGPK